MDSQNPALRRVRALESRFVPKKIVTHRTHIEDLPLEGYELSEEHLRLASGGISLGEMDGRTVGSTTNTAQTDDE